MRVLLSREHLALGVRPGDQVAAAVRDGELDLNVEPGQRGDLVARAHAEGEVLAAEHSADGTLLEARVPPGLAAQLEAALDDCVRVQA